jgi:tagatose-6-phosphate ketose/aldose isomerase
MQNIVSSHSNTIQTDGPITHAEILQQPELWPATLELVKRRAFDPSSLEGPVVITGAGTSAYAALAIAESWRTARAVPTTDLLLDARPFFEKNGLLISLARSGDSPESVAAIEKVQRSFPAVKHLAITCNPEGKLASANGVDVLMLDERTNDRSLAMTSSFSNIVLAGTALQHGDRLRSKISTICDRVSSAFASLEKHACEIASLSPLRVAILGSRSLYGAAREASLKILEMTAGQTIAIPETFLGLRHGPMSFLRSDALVVCLLSSDSSIRRYEEDLIEELRAKRLGHIVAIGPEESSKRLFDNFIPANAPELPDMLRTPFEIVFPQLLAYHLSLNAGLNPDNPSPDGVITRVVKGFRIHERQ